MINRMSKEQLPPHPGRIEVVDGDTNQVIREMDASTLPDGFRYAKTDDGWEAVTRIVETVRGAHLVWRAFADDGRVLRTGTARRD